MKRFVLLLPLALMLSGCAQLFDTNLYGTIDTAPPLKADYLKTLSTSQILQATSDPTFYEQLKADPAALAAVQEALNTALTNATTTQDKMDAAATLVMVTANATSVSEIADNAINNIGTIKDKLTANDYVGAIKIFLGNKTQAEVADTLTALVTMAATLETMQTIAMKPAPDKTVDAGIFFLGTENPSDFAQSALMAAIAKALVTDKGGVSATAAELVKATPVFATHTDIDAFNAGKGTSHKVDDAAVVGAGGYSYAYAFAVSENLAF